MGGNLWKEKGSFEDDPIATTEGANRLHGGCIWLADAKVSQWLESRLEKGVDTVH